MTDENTNIVKEVPKEKLDKIIRQHVWGAMGMSLVPLPVVDFVAVTGVQLNLLRVLAKAYDIPFFKDKVKNVLSAFIGAAIPTAAGAPLTASITKFIPVLGQTAGVVTMPILSGAATYAVGKVFIQHFASGGTFLTFDPDQVKAYYAEMFAEGKQMAANVQKEKAVPK